MQDVSHPDNKNQYDTVLSTLRTLTSEELSVINVANKIDKLNTDYQEDDIVPISATTGTGIYLASFLGLKLN